MFLFLTKLTSSSSAPLKWSSGSDGIFRPFFVEKTFWAFLSVAGNRERCPPHFIGQKLNKTVRKCQNRKLGVTLESNVVTRSSFFVTFRPNFKIENAGIKIVVINPTNKGRKNENRKGEARVRAKEQRQKEKERGEQASQRTLKVSKKNLGFVQLSFLSL